MSVCVRACVCVDAGTANTHMRHKLFSRVAFDHRQPPVESNRARRGGGAGCGPCYTTALPQPSAVAIPSARLSSDGGHGNRLYVWVNVKCTHVSVLVCSMGSGWKAGGGWV